LLTLANAMMGRVCTSLGGGTGAPDRIGIGEFIKGQFYADGKIKLKPGRRINERESVKPAALEPHSPQPRHRHQIRIACYNLIGTK
jgi:hypothetical protein